MHLFIAFVVIVVLIGLGFGRVMLFVGLASVGLIGLLIALMFYCLSVPGPSAQVSQAAAPTAQSAECDVNDLFPDPGTPGAACWAAYHAAHRVAQAERTDIYQQSLQILSGEKLTPLN